MELALLHTYPTLPSNTHYSHFYKVLQAPFNNKTVFPHSTKNPSFQFQFQFQARNFSRNGNNHSLILSEKELSELQIDEHEYETEEDAGTTSYSDDDSSFLSLSEKPDRNMALLDDYEMEELDYASNANHRSGLSLSIPILLGLLCFLILL